MRVDPSGTSPIVPSTSTSTPRVAAKSADTAAPTADSSSFSPSTDLAALLAHVRQAPDVRDDAVAAATAKLDAGALDTPQAATEAAKGFLESGGRRFGIASAGVSTSNAAAFPLSFPPAAAFQMQTLRGPRVASRRAVFARQRQIEIVLTTTFPARSRRGPNRVARDAVRKRIEFRQFNRPSESPPVGSTNLLLLRNVLIYFDVPTRFAILDRAKGVLRVSRADARLPRGTCARRAQVG